jgi:hypothetical protein
MGFNVLIHRPARLFAQVRWNDGLGHLPKTHESIFSEPRRLIATQPVCLPMRQEATG